MKGTRDFGLPVVYQTTAQRHLFFNHNSGLRA
jgi:hypothetical protein